MSRRRLPRHKKKTEVLAAAVTSAKAEAFRRACDRNGLTVSIVLRQAIDHYIRLDEGKAKKQAAMEQAYREKLLEQGEVQLTEKEIKKLVTEKTRELLTEYGVPERISGLEIEYFSVGKEETLAVVERGGGWNVVAGPAGVDARLTIERLEREGAADDIRERLVAFREELQSNGQ